MMKELTERTANARKSDPETSHEAATTVNVSYQRQVVLSALLYHDQTPQTDDDIYHTAAFTLNKTGITPQGLRSRRKYLIDEGLVGIASNDAKSANGHRCRSFILTDKGREYIESIS